LLIKNIILYSTHCPNCKYLEQLLEKKRITYQEINDITEMRQRGFMSVPILDVDGRIMTFEEAKQWVEEKEGND